MLTAASRAGVDAGPLVERARAPEGKARLRAATDAAIAAGVFGVPTMVADGEPFFGVDGLDFLDAFLDGRDPVPADALARWGGLPASAIRPGSRG